jgi:hypothetical protein
MDIIIHYYKISLTSYKLIIEQKKSKQPGIKHTEFELDDFKRK